MAVNPADFNDLTGSILNAAIEVHKTLGPGLLESTYLTAVKYELTARQLRFASQREVALVYKGVRLNSVFRIDLIVEDLVVVEVKSHAATLPVHQAQLLTYLRIANLPVGLLINFNVPRLMEGVKRVLNRACSAGLPEAEVRVADLQTDQAGRSGAWRALARSTDSTARREAAASGDESRPPPLLRSSE